MKIIINNMLEIKLNKYRNLLMQIIKFGIVGMLAFVIDYGILYVCTEWLNIYYLYSSIISFSISVIFNYIISVKWVFTVDNSNSRSSNFLFFIMFSLIGLGINQLIMWLGTSELSIYYMITKLIATIIVMIWNFITRKLFLEKR